MLLDDMMMMEPPSSLPPPPLAETITESTDTVPDVTTPEPGYAETPEPSPTDIETLKKTLDFSHLHTPVCTCGHASNGTGHAPRQSVWFCVPLRRLCQVSVALPSVGLALCFVIAIIFQFEHIQETACKVYNFVPSISAVTGINPGRYVWRVAVAFHIGPRIFVVITYYHFLVSFVTRVPAREAPTLGKMLNACFYLQCAEIVGLCGISFVHNREHYPTHEKSFILYLSSSHVTFLLVLRIYHVIWEHLNASQRRSFYKKCAIFAFSTVSIVLMAYFYYRHIVHCDDLAFSIFAFIEYFVAAANIAYYWTIADDLPDEEIVVQNPLWKQSSMNGLITEKKEQ